MNTLRNVPIMLTSREDGTVLAECLVLPECRCTGPNRHRALEAMDKLVRAALKGKARLPVTHYEIVHLALPQPPPSDPYPSAPPSSAPSSSAPSSSAPSSSDRAPPPSSRARGEPRENRVASGRDDDDGCP